MLAYDTIIEIPADEILPGDIIDTRCGIADYAWKTVTATRVIERTHGADRVELTLDTDAMCVTRESSAHTIYRVIPDSPLRRTDG
jgi:hypothetical protein